MHYKELEKLALGSGFAHAVPLDTTTISLKQEVRDMCKNGCQQYARRWSCPPGCGSLNELRERICHYKKGILVQTVTELEDEFDISITPAEIIPENFNSAAALWAMVQRLQNE